MPKFDDKPASSSPVREPGPYAKAPVQKPPPAPAEQPGDTPAAAAEQAASPDAGGMAEILTKLTAIQTTQSSLATKEDIKDLATRTQVTEEVEEAKEWARERFARKDQVMPRLRALEKAQADQVDRELQVLRTMTANTAYIGNLGEDDKDKTIKDWVQKSCTSLGAKFTASIWTLDKKKHAVFTFDSSSQAKAVREALKKKDIKNAAGKPIQVRQNKDKKQRELEAPLVAMRERLLKLYGGDVGKPTTAVIIQGSNIKVGGVKVVKLDGLGGTKWLKGAEPKKVKQALRVSEGTQDDEDEDMEEDEEDGEEAEGELVDGSATNEKK